VHSPRPPHPSQRQQSCAPLPGVHAAHRRMVCGLHAHPLRDSSGGHASSYPCSSSGARTPRRRCQSARTYYGSRELPTQPKPGETLTELHHRNSLWGPGLLPRKAAKRKLNAHYAHRAHDPASSQVRRTTTPHAACCAPQHTQTRALPMPWPRTVQPSPRRLL